eukprot:TRINITY_DN3778_c0_g1_i1.p1 TRINITY_DN3778_c0_g1~~TRINITY_DN3778_c0_g1_i1.p1  ORF type:complete len:324 (-),score=44.30 TRINITY_DN3778_c0_g1_i1:409-1380(-)
MEGSGPAPFPKSSFYSDEKLSLKSMRDFISTFKTEKCLKPPGMCKFDTFKEEDTKDIFAICRWHHNQADMRRSPFINRSRKEVLYSNELCPEYDHSKKRCPHTNCKLSRNLFEYNYHPWNYKMYQCRFYLTEANGCFLGRKCYNFHDVGENYTWVSFMDEEKRATTVNPQAQRLLTETHKFYVKGEQLKKEATEETNTWLVETYNVDSILEKLLQLLNKNGGKVICGINNDGLIVGVEASDNELWVATDKLKQRLLKSFPPVPEHFVSISLIRILDKADLKLVPKTYVLEMECKRSCFYHLHPDNSEPLFDKFPMWATLTRSL